VNEYFDNSKGKPYPDVGWFPNLGKNFLLSRRSRWGWGGCRKKAWLGFAFLPI